MNIKKITYKIIKDSMDDEFILKMMISYLSEEQSWMRSLMKENTYYLKKEI